MLILNLINTKFLMLHNYKFIIFIIKDMILYYNENLLFIKFKKNINYKKFHYYIIVIILINNIHNNIVIVIKVIQLIIIKRLNLIYIFIKRIISLLRFIKVLHPFNIHLLIINFINFFIYIGSSSSSATSS